MKDLAIIFLTALCCCLVALGVLTRLLWTPNQKLWDFAFNMTAGPMLISCFTALLVLGYAIGCVIKHFNP